MKKILYFDVETTGLDPVNDHIFQLSGMIEVDGEIKEEFNYYLRPPTGTRVSLEALKVTGKTVEELRGYPDSFKSYDSLINIMGVYVDQYKRFKTPDDKFYPCAYNGNFDLQFLDNFFKKMGDHYFGSWQNWQLIDPLQTFRLLSFLDQLHLPNHKLETVCKHFGVSIEAHDALSDIRATRDLVQVLKNGLKFDLWANAQES